MRQLLSNIRVVELARDIPGAYCGKLFADLGSVVVKVEVPTVDGTAQAPAGGGGVPVRTGAVIHLNTNKRSVILDPALASDQATLRALLASSDLIIESVGCGDLGEWSASWAELHTEVPSLSVVSISGFGRTGPYASYRWSDLVAQAFSGALITHGRSDPEPIRLPAHTALCFVGHVAALGALAAVVSSEAGGAGSFVDCAAVEALATLPPRMTTLLGYEYRGRTPGPDSWRLSAVSETLMPIGVFPCRDGHVAIMSTPQQLGAMLEVLDDEALRDAFARPDAFERTETKEAVDAALFAWLLSHTREEATAAAQRVGWPLTGVNSPDEVLGADHFHQRGFWVHTDDPVVGAVDIPGPPCRFAEGGWALRRTAPRPGQDDGWLAAELEHRCDASRTRRDEDDRRHPDGPARLALEGVRVVDLSTVWSGPYATMLLADLGAEVIRVENPWVLPPSTKGYQARPTSTNLGYLGSLYGPVAPGRPDRPWNRHAMNNCLARNKLSCTIDIRRPEGRELLMRLLELSDVFIDNLKADGLDRLQISVSELRRRNPALIVVRMPPAGLTGDWSGYTGFGLQFDGLTGLLWLLGHRGQDLMTTPGTTYMDAASGPAAAFATIAALRYRSVTGRGQVVELAQSENIANHLGDVLVDRQLGAQLCRMGNRDLRSAPQGLYPCQGEGAWLALTVDSDDAWRSLTTVIGKPELAEDRRYGDAVSRLGHQDELDELVRAWASGRSLLDAFHELQAAGVPAAPLLDEEHFAHDAHVGARSWLRPLHSADVGTHLHPGPPYRGLPLAWRRGSPTLGEDNDYVYKALLGVSDDEFETYQRAKILAEDYLDPSGQPY